MEFLLRKHLKTGATTIFTLNEAAGGGYPYFAVKLPVAAIPRKAEKWSLAGKSLQNRAAVFVDEVRHSPIE
jgi:hypothetical protein